VILERKRQIYLALVLAFLLGNYKGYIALWSGTDPEPMVVFPYRTDSLPPADQAALENGIPLENREQLTHLLEDFLS